MKKKILVTGGAGYIGSHTLLCLLEEEHEVVVLDNFSNSSLPALNRVKELSGKDFTIVDGDLRDRVLLEKLFATENFASVVHFAGLKAVGDSVKDPISYYENNVACTINLCRCMANAGVFEFIFSSSATVYGEPSQNPLTESTPTGVPTNPYGRSKLFNEEILKDIANADPRWRIAILRYFNPIGAHESGRLGESPNGTPNNLVPYISQVAIGKLDKLAVFGNDYPTTDGTGVRDYIHVVDLAIGHLRALDAIRYRQGISIWNLGRGQGYSVLQLIRAFEAASGKHIPFNIAPRRPGDIAESWTDPTKAKRDLRWEATRGLDQMMLDTWRWQASHPDGFK